MCFVIAYADSIFSYSVCRPLIRQRVTMKRREFGNDNNGQFIDKEPSESTYDLKNFGKMGTQMYQRELRELEIGLQAANRMVNDQTQTYYNRSVNAISYYDAQDFIG